MARNSVALAPAREANGSSDLKTIRCAIYTRKSTEEGLQQEFNSLDAQREASEAFVASQKNEGWQVITDHFDDGGYILERTEDSGTWPSDYSNSKNVRLRRPQDVPTPPPPPPPPPKPGILTARAELRSNQIQDLADQISQITLVAAGMDLKFTVQVELSGTNAGSAESVAKLNDLLEAVSEELRLR